MTVVSTDEKFTRLMQSRTDRRTSRGTLLDIEGTLTIGGYSFDLSACVGADDRAKTIRTAQQGPKPGGKVPASDLPGGAKLLAVNSDGPRDRSGLGPMWQPPD